MKEKNNLVSVIIATFNSERTIEFALKAIRGQSYSQDLIEILVIDGMSTDNTRAIAESYGCKIFDNPKVEQGNAKIIGMQAAKGKYILFVDSDEVLEFNKAIENTVSALESIKSCYLAICSGYKKPDNYSNLTGYISDLGDPFSFFVYGVPKDYRFFHHFIRMNYDILEENNDYIVYNCDLIKRFILLEGGCGGIMMNMEYFDSVIPECRKSISTLYHSFYKMCDHGDTKVIYMKNDPLVHYSSDKLWGYLRKLKWRVCNNIHYLDKGEEVYSGREKYEQGTHLKKYLFIPYAVSFAVPFIHSIPYAITRRNPFYLFHCVFSFYVVIEVIYQYCLKMLHITPAFLAYGSNKRIK